MDRRRLREGLGRRLRGLPAWARWATSPYPPGHYHSPLPDIASAKQLLLEADTSPTSLPGIDVCRGQQLELLEEFTGYYRQMPFRAQPAAHLRYHLDCKWFAHGDGVALYCMLRHARPQRYMEIGSGFSSACALDTADLFLEHSVEFTFIEPNPERLRSVLRPTDNVNIIERPMTRLEPVMFESLVAGDILFIDSSHVTRIGSEVNDLFLDVIPSLKPGVHIHIHDIFWPFTYPLHWLEHGRAWNEAYLVRAWLCDNPKARIRWFNSYLANTALDTVAKAMPMWGTDAGSSLWIETMSVA